MTWIAKSVLTPDLQEFRKLYKQYNDYTLFQIVKEKDVLDTSYQKRKEEIDKRAASQHKTQNAYE